jgi:RNA polymerase sigma factor (sigma-70 family)
MASRLMKPMNRIVRHLRRAVLLRDGHEVTDGRLLESFRTCADEAAFEILVKRHGPMVLGVCRRVIGNIHDAEDALQAVFLVLAKKAASIAQCDLVGNWLYGVAYRTALQARARLGRRRAREIQVKDMPQPTVSSDMELHELHQALDLELNKLPDKYRVPIVLCDLEGRPRKDVAGRLKVPEGTLSSRLAKGRQLLARRLLRHGLALSGAALATVLTHQTASASIRAVLVTSMVKAAGLAAAGQSAAGFVPVQVLALSQGVLKTMLLHKLKAISLVCLGLVLGGVGAGFGIPRAKAQPAVPAAQSGQPGQAGQSGRPGIDDQEPIDGSLLMNQQIQTELRLSKNQIHKLQALSREVDGKNDVKHKEIQELQKRIDELQQQIAQIQKRIDGKRAEAGTIRSGIEGQRGQALGKAAPEILSARALKRVREIQRQKRGLRALLQDPKVQHMLKLDDEQLRKIETILKKERVGFWDITSQAGLGFIDLDSDGWPDLFLSSMHLKNGTGEKDPRRININTSWLGQLYRNNGDGTYTLIEGANSPTNRLLMDVLTDTQKRTLLHWVGEPYHSPSWQELWDKHAKKGAMKGSADANAEPINLAFWSRLFSS